MILENIPDPRYKRGVRYKYSHLLLICIYAVLAGYSDAIHIAAYAELYHEYFTDLLGMQKMPSHDTFSRVLRFTSFESLSQNLGLWLRENFPETYEKYAGYRVLHVDGKAARAASEKSNGEKPIYHLNAMYEGESIGVEIMRVGKKDNEISVLPTYLKQFNLEDTIVTVDAIGCNTKVIAAINNGGGNYVVPVKGNQKGLLEEINREIEKYEKSTDDWKKLDLVTDIHLEHGRIEKIEMRLIHNTSFIYEKLGIDSFYGTIAKVGIMDKTTKTKKEGKWEETRNRSIYITDVENMTVDLMYKIRASHWNIEMRHWILDVQLGEDRKTARRNDAVTNGSILRRFCMIVKNKDPELSKKSLTQFQMWNQNPKRTEQLLFGSIAKCD